MYAIIPQQIPRDKRAEVNEKILFAIDSGKDLIPKESIYNCYTGIGGLHNLKQADFSSYHRYAEAKKEFEMGQFFTPHELCRSMVEVLSPTSSEMVLDMCCGMGNFFNHLPNLHNSYGFDIDGRAVTVARHLYPEAHIEKCDIQQYRPEQRFDVIIGNPPFNLKFDCKLSQEYYMDKAYDVLNPAGFLMVIVPVSFMQSEFWEKTRVANINSSFSFVGQTKLNPDAFDSMGVHNFSTKVMVFLRRSRHIEMQPYNADEFIPMEELKDRVRKTRAMKQRIRIDLMRETNRIDREELEAFEYRLSKYMYELKGGKRMLVDKTEFEAWMERIMGELYRISRKLDKAETREKHLNYLNGERLYDNQEVCLLLRISKRTLQRYRNNGVLKFYSIYHKTYYKESDLHEFIRNNFDENEIKRQAREDKLSESYPLPKE